MHTRSPFLVVMVLLGVFAMPAFVGAQTPEEQQQARAFFEQGLAATDAERWAEAADYFRRSRALVERPSTVFNLASALYRLGRYVEGINAAKDYLRISDPQSDAARRTQIEALLPLMERAVGRARIAVTPSDATVEVDGEKTREGASDRELMLDPGVHALAAAREGYAPFRSSFTLESGATVDLKIALEQEAPKVAVGPLNTAPSKDDDAPKSKTWRRVAWISGAVLVVAATSAVLLLTLPGEEKSEEPSGGSTDIVIDL